MNKTCREAYAAAFLTFGLAGLLAALAAGHADDAPGVGLIGLGFFFLCALSAFRSVRVKDSG